MSGKGKNQVEETASQRAMASFARAQMDDYRQRWLPVQKQLAAQVQDMGEEGSAQRKQAAGVSNADTEQAFGLAEAKLEKAMSNSGAAVGSSKSNLAIAGMGDDKARAKGLGLTGADQRVDDAYTQGLASVMAMGKGEKTQAGASMAQQAQMSAQQARQDAELSLQDRAQTAELAGQAVGYGVQRYTSAGPRVPSATPTALPSTQGVTTDFGLSSGYGTRLGGAQ